MFGLCDNQMQEGINKLKTMLGLDKKDKKIKK